ncbi:MAG: radical SAM protein [Oscillospiraceae bacterium]|nr:radical SAM protein [Oscillospiraceae bacterium]
MIQEIFAPDPAAAGILRKQSAAENAELRPSIFQFPFEHRGGCYLYQSLTKQCLQVDPALFQAAREPEALLSPEDRRFLTEHWFLVPAEKDETALFEGLQRLLRLRTARSRPSGFTILTTTACNARCFYCVERGMPAVTMSPETVEATVAHILRSRDRAHKVHLRWFGGEPLAAPQVIDRISEALTGAEVDFDAAMISNGILIDEKTMEKMRGPWRIRRLQITLDGPEEEYNRRKNYRAAYPSAWRELLAVLRRLSETPIAVVLRCNVDRDNADGLGRMLEELAAALPKKDRFYLYFTPLYAQKESTEHAALFRRCLEAKVLARDLGFPYAPTAPLHRFRHTLCMAENPFGSQVISPEGLLFNCDMMPAGSSCGSVREGIARPELLQRFARPEPVAARCRDCPYLTSCTSFTGCPVKPLQCRQVRKLELLYDLRCELDKGEKKGEAPEETPELIC